MKKELELTDAMVERNDEIDNAVFDCVKTLSEQPDMDWNMAIIGDVTDSMKAALKRHSIKVRHPGVVTNDDGSQFYAEYDEE